MMLAFAIDPSAQIWMTAMERACWQGGAALLVAWIICQLWRSMPGRAQCWVWRLAYAKLLLALVWAAPLNLYLLPAHQEKSTTPQRSAVVPQTASFAMSHVRPSAPSVIPPSAGHPIDGSVILLATWAFGVGCVLVLTVSRTISTIRLRRECEPIEDPEILRACEKIAVKLGIKRSPPILQSRSAASPMLVGPFRPAIVLPTVSMERRRSQIEMILAHELAHHRRHDLFWNWPVALADVLLFFHPLVWLARRESRLAQELASDQLVLEMTENAAPEYAQTLLSIALRKRSARPPAFAVGALTSRKSLHRRIVAMSRFSNWSSARWTIAGAIIVTLALLIIPPWRVVAADKEGSPSATTNPSHAGSAGQNPAGPSNRSGIMPGMGSASSRTTELVGEVVAATIKFRPPVAGTLEKVEAQDGQRVKQGQVIFELDGRRANADMRVSQAQIQLAKSELRRAQALATQKTISQEDLDTKVANVEIAEANLELKKLALEQLSIRAPFDGVVHTGFIAGEQVSPSDFLGDLIQIDALGVSFSLPQALIGRVKVGQEIQIRSHSDARPMKAQVNSIAPIVDQASGTVGVQARLLEKTSRLLPGMSVTVSIEPAAADAKPDDRNR